MHVSASPHANNPATIGSPRLSVNDRVRLTRPVIQCTGWIGSPLVAVTSSSSGSSRMVASKRSESERCFRSSLSARSTTAVTEYVPASDPITPAPMPAASDAAKSEGLVVVGTVEAREVDDTGVALFFGELQAVRGQPRGKVAAASGRDDDDVG